VADELDTQAADKKDGCARVLLDAIPGDTALIKGDRIVIVGDDPWAGQVGELLTWEAVPNGLQMWRVWLDLGTTCYARPENIRKMPT
jgi:hypothetical protein